MDLVFCFGQDWICNPTVPFRNSLGNHLKAVNDREAKISDALVWLRKPN